MFENDDDDDDDDDDFIESDFDKWFYAHEADLPRELVNDSENNDVELSVFYETYNNIIGPLTRAISLLLPEQYSLFDDEIRPPVLQKIEEIAQETASSLLFELFDLVYDQKSGVNLREKYSPFDDYIKNHGRPPQPQFMGDEYRGAAPQLTDEEWAERLRIINIGIQEEFDEENTPRVEFIDAVQSVLLSHYTELLNLNADEWIIYATILNNEYCNYQDRCWLIDSFIAYELPESDLALPDSELERKIVDIRKELWAEEDRQRTEQQKNES